MAKKNMKEVTRKAMDIQTDLIDHAPWNPRPKITKKSVENLMESIRSNGLIHRIDVIEDENGRYVAIAGNRRLFACKELGMEKIPCDVLEIDEAGARAMTLTENLQREGADPFMQADNIEKLLSMGKTIEEIAADTGFGITWVYRHKQLMNIIPEYRKMHEETPFTLEALEKISRYDKLVQQLAYEDINDQYRNEDNGNIRWEEIRRTFERMTLDLSNAKFKTDECRICHKNTANEPMLFDVGSDKKDCAGCGKCQDKECYKRKYNEWLETEKTKLEKKYGKLKHYKNSYHVPGYPSDNKTKEHPVPYTTEDYDGTVKIVWGREAKKDKAGDMTPEERKAERDRKRAEKAARELHNRAIAKIHSWLDTNATEAAKTLLDHENAKTAQEIIAAAIIKAVKNYDDDIVLMVGKALGLKVMDLDDEEIASVESSEEE